ncbi:MAG TPA: hypothetical protein VKU85_00695 [bacterium]|nr:hypothetical protein [bacterium]
MKFRIPAAALIACLAMAVSAFAQPAGPPGGMIYANDDAYKTVGTPADLPNHGNFDQIYVMGERLANVADAAPGDRDWNGGRWEVHMITWNVTPTQYTNADDVLAAESRGDLSIGPVVRRFECPLIRQGRR